jgi:hypothetical protein
MTRILVVGAGDPEDTTFVHSTLWQVDNLYGPITCVIHANHPQALAWQQAVAKQRRVLHKPIVEDRNDGIMSAARWRTRLFDEGRPDYVVVFDIIKMRLLRKQVELIIFMAQRRGIPVLTYSKDKKPTEVLV